MPRRIARVRATDYLNDEKVLGPDGFEVDLAICPEQVLTDYIVKLVEFPEALQVLDFAARQGEPGRGARIPGRAAGRAIRCRELQQAHSEHRRADRRHLPRRHADRCPTATRCIEAGDEVFLPRGGARTSAR